MNWYPNRCFASQVYGSQTADNSSDCVIAVVLVYVREAEHKIYDVNTLTNIGARWISRIARTVSGSPGHNSLGSGVPFLPVFMRPCLSSFPFRLPPVSYTRGRCPQCHLPFLPLPSLLLGAFVCVTSRIHPRSPFS